MDRRTFLMGGTGLALGGALSCALSSSRFSAGQVEANLVDTHRESFLCPKGWIFFYDAKSGKILKKVSLPNNWDNFTRASQQAWRDTERREIGKTYNLSRVTEKEIPVTSPHGSLRGESSGATIASLTNEYGKKVTRGDEKNRTRIQYVYDEFSHLLQGYPFASRILASHSVGLAGGESRFDSDLVSQAAAVGIFQIMPHMIGNDVINPNKYPINEVQKSLKKQVELAKNIFLDNWSRLKTYIPKIARQYFSGNNEQAIEYVILPLLITAYNTGYPNIKKLIDGFLSDFPDQESIQSKYGVKYSGSMGADIYYYMTQYGRYDAKISTYGKDSALYYYKTRATALVVSMNTGMKPAQEIGTASGVERVTKTLVHSAIGGGVGVVLSRILPDDNHRASRIVDGSRRNVLVALGALTLSPILMHPGEAIGLPKKRIKTPEIKSIEEINSVRKIVNNGGRFFLGDPVRQEYVDDIPRSIASLSKLLTALVVYDICKEKNIDIKRYKIEISQSDKKNGVSKNQQVPIKRAFTIEQLLDMALVKSTNEAAEALSRGIIPRVEFVRRMNQKARSLGMTKSKFTNPSGIQSSNTSTIGDLERLTVGILNSPYPIGKTTQKKETKIPGVKKGKRNKEGFLGSANVITLSKIKEYGATPVLTKTGFISKSGKCEITVFRVPSGNLYSIVLLDANNDKDRKKAVWSTVKDLVKFG